MNYPIKLFSFLCCRQNRVEKCPFPVDFFLYHLFSRIYLSNTTKILSSRYRRNSRWSNAGIRSCWSSFSSKIQQSGTQGLKLKLLIGQNLFPRTSFYFPSRSWVTYTGRMPSLTCFIHVKQASRTWLRWDPVWHEEYAWNAYKVLLSHLGVCHYLLDIFYINQSENLVASGYSVM